MNLFLINMPLHRVNVKRLLQITLLVLYNEKVKQAKSESG